MKFATLLTLKQRSGTSSSQHFALQICIHIRAVMKLPLCHALLVMLIIYIKFYVKQAQTVEVVRVTNSDRQTDVSAKTDNLSTKRFCHALLLIMLIVSVTFMPQIQTDFSAKGR